MSNIIWERFLVYISNMEIWEQFFKIHLSFVDLRKKMKFVTHMRRDSFF